MHTHTWLSLVLFWRCLGLVWSGLVWFGLGAWGSAVALMKRVSGLVCFAWKFGLVYSVAVPTGGWLEAWVGMVGLVWLGCGGSIALELGAAWLVVRELMKRGSGSADN